MTMRMEFRRGATFAALALLAGAVTLLDVTPARADRPGQPRGQAVRGQVPRRLNVVGQPRQATKSRVVGGATGEGGVGGGHGPQHRVARLLARLALQTDAC